MVTEMDAFNQKCTKSYAIQSTGCMVSHIPNHIYFKLVPAELDGLSVAHVVFEPSVKSLVSLCGRARCIYLCIQLNIIYSADGETMCFPNEIFSK